MTPKILYKYFVAFVIFAAMLLSSCGERKIAPQHPLPPPTPESIAPQESDNLANINVFYATDRQRSPGKTVDYGHERADALQYGVFQVSIPRDHRMASIERPSIWRFEFKENAKKHLVITSRTPLDEASFYQDVSTTVHASKEKQVLVFIHGFNVTFTDAVYRTAQMTYDLGFSGASILYSWPSNGRLRDYTWDSTANEWTVPHLQAFLESVAAKTGAQKIHVIAHSMGNRALAHALRTMPQAKSPRFQNVILTAPDIDAGVFTELSDAVKSHADNVTLYASSHDKAMLASEEINGFWRAGDAGKNIVVIPGIDTIDVSLVDTNLIGHFYYGENRSVLTDMMNLITTDDPPSKRCRLQQTGIAPKLYWRFIP